MKTHALEFFSAALLLTGMINRACAQPRTSTDYTILFDTLDSAGGAGSSADYQFVGSLNAIGGAINAGSSNVTLWNGYIGQLVELAATPCTPPPSGLVAWWQAEGNAADFTGNHSGTIASAPLSVPGKVGEAFFLDGGTNYVDIPYSPSLFSLAQGTLEMWVRIPDLTIDTIRLFSIAKTGIAAFAPGSYEWELDYRGDNQAIQLVVINNGILTTSVLATNGILNTNFHHLAVVADGVGMNEVYVDGVAQALSVPPIAQSGNDAFFAAANGSDNMKIGAVLREALGPSGLVLIDEVSLYNRPLNAGEIQAIYATGNYGKCVGDSDNDGLPDAWEIAHGLNPNNPADAALDSDSDGMTNRDEFIAGTDPQDLASRLVLEEIQSAPSALKFKLRCKASKNYSVLYKNLLDEADWTKDFDIEAEPTEVLRTITIPIPGRGPRFYKVVTPKLP